VNGFGRIVLVVVALALLVAGGRYAMGLKAARDAEKAERDRNAECARYLDDRNAYFVKQCLDQHRLGARAAEGISLLARLTGARSEAVAKLRAAPPLLAMLKEWVAAKAADPSLAIRVKVTHGDGDLFPSGEVHASSIDEQKILADLASVIRDKLPPGLDFQAGEGCSSRGDDVGIEAIYSVHESGETSTLEYGSKTAMVRILAYDVEVVACYRGRRSSIVSIKDRSMPLREGYSVESDPTSVEYMAQHDMDRGAEALIEESLQNALGI